MCIDSPSFIPPEFSNCWLVYLISIQEIQQLFAYKLTGLYLFATVAKAVARHVTILDLPTPKCHMFNNTLLAVNQQQMCFNGNRKVEIFC